ncbi:uncharacterized [Tachysurus ichikawai]
MSQRITSDPLRRRSSTGASIRSQCSTGLWGFKVTSLRRRGSMDACLRKECSAGTNLEKYLTEELECYMGLCLEPDFFMSYSMETKLDRSFSMDAELYRSVSAEISTCYLKSHSST